MSASFDNEINFILIDAVTPYDDKLEDQIDIEENPFLPYSRLESSLDTLVPPPTLKTEESDETVDNLNHYLINHQFDQIATNSDTQSDHEEKNNNEEENYDNNEEEKYNNDEPDNLSDDNDRENYDNNLSDDNDRENYDNNLSDDNDRENYNNNLSDDNDREN